jgi:hypothetical protein
MVSMTQLILPIVISAILVFIVAALVWMVAPHHKHDWKGLANEDEVRSAMNAMKPAPGMYMIPFAGTPQARAEPAFQKKFEAGPVAYLTVRRSGSMSMGPNLAQSLIYYLVVSSIVGYLAIHALPFGSPYLKVFQVVGTAAWLAYGFGTVSDSIWFSKPWSSTLKQIFDGLLFAMVTAGAFGWRWPR